MTAFEPTAATERISLPAPATSGAGSMEAALKARRSVRDFGAEPLAMETVGQLLWAAQGITGADGGRTAPSAGALYPLEIDLVAGAVVGLPAGLYRYLPAEHALWLRCTGDLRESLHAAAIQQHAVAEAPVVIAIAAVAARSEGKYAARAERYIHMEAGHAAQNITLQAAALELGSVVVGAFDDTAVSESLRLKPGEQPLVLLPIGHPR